MDFYRNTSNNFFTNQTWAASETIPKVSPNFFWEIPSEVPAEIPTWNKKNTSAVLSKITSMSLEIYAQLVYARSP